MNMTPLEQPTLRGIFATEGLADNFLTAVERGSHVPIELSDRWDHWAWVDKPLEEARIAVLCRRQGHCHQNEKLCFLTRFPSHHQGDRGEGKTSITSRHHMLPLRRPLRHKVCAR
jgi:hypothetical protein